jgi:transcription termination factor Rho
MDDLDLSAPEADASAKKPRKAPAKRARARGAEASTEPAPLGATPEQGVAAADAVPARAKRTRTRRGKAPESEASAPGAAGASELFTSEGVESGSADEARRAENAAPAADPAETPRVYSFSPDEEAPAARAEEPAGGRPVFVPAGMAESASSATADNPAASDAPHDVSSDLSSDAPPVHSTQGGGDQGGGPGGRREERKSWWERKKEKKRQKWLERQAGGGGGGGGGGGPGAGQGGGGHGGHGGAVRERAPAQPPPPSFQAAVGALPADDRFSDLAALDALAEELARDPAPLDLGAIHAAGAGDLAQRLRAMGETVVGMPPRRVLVDQIFSWAAREKHALRETGVLDLNDAGQGFVVHRHNSYRLYPESTFVPASLVKRHGLRRGQEVDVLAQPPKPGERCASVVRIVSVMGTQPELAREVTAFEELIPYYPTSRILVEAPDIHKDISMRAVDLLTPIGFGQRGLIVAPPRTGKTVLLQNIANSVSNNYPEATLILLLIDERPEEVTDFRRHTKGEVVSSTFDEAPESHVHAAEMVIERARRLVEMGKHVVILLDSITRLARAYNALAGNSGKIMSGGIEANALQRPKRFFGSARNIEGGGSLTILGTALIDTNSRMDEVIFEEFKGTGNMELHLDRGLSDKRIFPAINIDRSGTRKEELIYHPDEMLRVYGLRRAMQGIPPVEAMDMFIQRLKKTRTNTEFLLSLNR